MCNTYFDLVYIWMNLNMSRDSFYLNIRRSSDAFLQELDQRGPNAYPGARYVVRDTSDRIDLRRSRQTDAFYNMGGEYVLPIFSC
jgi:hypothetical protein